MEIFGKLEINLPFLQALKLPPFGRFIKEFIARKAQSDGKIVIGRTSLHPEGVLENVIVKINDFLYPADFHVIRMSESEAAGTSGVLLGRPFLRTAKTIIDIFDGTICLDYHGEKYTFNIDETMKKPMDVENLHSVDVIAPLIQEYLETELMEKQLAGS
ncbi:hypothetical protein AAHA92_09434 [Salvia divinorum]|uniref:Uncharacterized protein n=1 Tax=Salvia divinorum TaxID=28513 RepID=A0ABD1HVF7_SALDI